MANMLSSFQSSRCPSKLYITDEASEDGYYYVQCSGQSGHDTAKLHRGFSVSKLTVRWTDVDAEKSRREIFKPLIRNKPFVGWRTWNIKKYERVEFPSHVPALFPEYSIEQLTKIYLAVKGKASVPGSEFYELVKQHGFTLERMGGEIVYEYSLHSTATNYEWGPVATLQPNQKLEKDVEHRGVYALKSPQLLVDNAIGIRGITGRVDLTGRVIEHQFGYRAEVCTIRELWLFNHSLNSFTRPENRTDYDINEIQKQFEQKFQCPVHVVKNGENQLRHWAKYFTEEYRES